MFSSLQQIQAAFTIDSTHLYPDDFISVKSLTWVIMSLHDFVCYSWLHQKSVHFNTCFTSLCGLWQLCTSHFTLELLQALQFAYFNVLTSFMWASVHMLWPPPILGLLHSRLSHFLFKTADWFSDLQLVILLTCEYQGNKKKDLHPPTTPHLHPPKSL